MRKGMYVYPWDLEDEGIENVIGRLRDAGLDTLSIATSYHAGRFLRPHAPRGRVYFPQDGSIYFQPEPRRYGRIKPIVNSQVGSLETLRDVHRLAPDFTIVGWTVGLHNTPLGTAHPDLVAHNAFGDPLFNSLCPAQPAVREYLVALCADLGNNQPVAEVVIETAGWQPFRHGHHHEFELVALSPRVETMLGMCFCNACTVAAVAAGLDIAALAHGTRRQLERFFVDGTEPATDPQTDPVWRAFLAWRAGVVTSLVAEVRAALAASVGLAIIPTVQTPNTRCWIEGNDLAELASQVGRLEISAYRIGVAAIAKEVAAIRNAAGESARLGFILRPTYPSLIAASEVHDAVRALADTRPESVSFYNYGHMRLQSLDWIAAALS